MKFQVGDKVKAFGFGGQVIEIDLQSEWPVKVKFPLANAKEDFKADGKLFDWHAEPSLVLIERPKPEPKYVKKTMYLGVGKNMRLGVNLHDLPKAAQEYPDAIGYAPIEVFVVEDAYKGKEECSHDWGTIQFMSGPPKYKCMKCGAWIMKGEK